MMKLRRKNCQIFLNKILLIIKFYLFLLFKDYFMATHPIVAGDWIEFQDCLHPFFHQGDVAEIVQVMPTGEFMVNCDAIKDLMWEAFRVNHKEAGRVMIPRYLLHIGRVKLIDVSKIDISKVYERKKD